ncbi:PLDc N-terminal domain-containing protein [Stutzerimonas sp. VN223-3]|uniref:PLDc N-terminal domain-containing protein n=1 Tax=Stutzerimonas TaxID=2901164 RepID=UPI00210CA059|nr:PLDc N-terminal domain-containing protein [Stutzerimonas stutzeri]
METWSALLAVVVLVADLLAIVQVWRSRIEIGRKIIWSLVIVLLPVVGLIMWLVAAGHFAKVRL